MSDDEHDRALAEYHAVLDLLHDERQRRAIAEARLRDIEGSRTWRWATRVRRALGRAPEHHPTLESHG